MKALPVTTEVGNDIASFNLAISKTILTDEIVGNLTDDQLHVGVRDSMIRGVAAYNDFRHLLAEVKFRLIKEEKTVGGCSTFKDYVEKYLTAKIESTETALRRAYRQVEDLEYVKKEGAQHTGRPKAALPKPSKAAPKTNAHVVAEGTVRQLEGKLKRAQAKIEKLVPDVTFTYWVVRNELNGEYVCLGNTKIANQKRLKYAQPFFSLEDTYRVNVPRDDKAVIEVTASVKYKVVIPALNEISYELDETETEDLVEEEAAVQS